MIQIRVRTLPKNLACPGPSGTPLCWVQLCPQLCIIYCFILFYQPPVNHTVLKSWQSRRAWHRFCEKKVWSRSSYLSINIWSQAYMPNGLTQFMTHTFSVLCQCFKQGKINWDWLWQWNPFLLYDRVIGLLVGGGKGLCMPEVFAISSFKQDHRVFIVTLSQTKVSIGCSRDDPLNCECTLNWPPSCYRCQQHTILCPTR